jgi:hypothetical protein
VSFVHNGARQLEATYKRETKRDLSTEMVELLWTFAIYAGLWPWAGYG